MLGKFVIGALLLILISTDLRAETRWFVVAEIESQHGDSYLLPLQDPEHIEQARRLITQGPGGDVGSIASVRIAAGSDGLNRDVKSADGDLWSWHVAEFSGFADFTIELCDGWPGLIEADVTAFINNTQGQVCFWAYTLVAELENAPGFRINRAQSGAWFNPQTSGQGILLEVLEDRGQVFAAWFTFAQSLGKVGSAGHRWLTALGDYSESTATLEITLTTGGLFNDPAPVVHSPTGSLVLSFSDCNHGLMRYQINAGPSGEIELQRPLPLSTCGQP